MKRHTIAILICLTLIACGGYDEEALEDRVSILETESKRHRHVDATGRQTSEPILSTLLPKTKKGTDETTDKKDDDHTPSDNAEPPKEDVPPLVIPPATPNQIGRIAFESTGHGVAEIYAIDSDGKNLTNLTKHGAHDTRPDWSPDGKLIAFVSERAGGPKIFVMDANGDNQRILVDMVGLSLSDPAWSPNGGTVAFNTGKGIHIGGNLPPTFIAKGRGPDWSVLGEIAFVLDGDIYVMNALGGDPVRITDPPHKELYPAWSPDGRLIAYTANSEIYIMNADGTNRTNITNHPGDDRAPDWSPNGRQIAFMSNRNESFNWEIYVMNADGSNQKNITNNAQTTDVHPSWRP